MHGALQQSSRPFTFGVSLCTTLCNRRPDHLFQRRFMHALCIRRPDHILSCAPRAHHRVTGAASTRPPTAERNLMTEPRAQEASPASAAHKVLSPDVIHFLEQLDLNFEAERLD